MTKLVRPVRREDKRLSAVSSDRSAAERGDLDVDRRRELPADRPRRDGLSGGAGGVAWDRAAIGPANQSLPYEALTSQESRMDLLSTCGSACSLGREFVLTPAPAVRAGV